MLEVLKELYGKFSYLGVSDTAALLAITRLKNYPAGSTIVKTGDKNYNSYVVIKGLIRNYIERPDGEERTILFAAEGMNTASHATIFHNRPATETITTLEDSLLAVHDMRDFEKVCHKHPNILRAYNEALKVNIDEAVERLAYYTSMNPEERYVHFSENHPELLQRVPLMYLASYLGITPVSLSRIRSRVAQQSRVA